MDPFKIRVIVPAYNSGKTLIDCIKAVFSALSFTQNNEVFIVDNGKNEEILSSVSEFPVTIISNHSKASAAFARNEGAKGFYDGIIIFIDSDVICEINSIRNLIEPIVNKKCVATIGNYSNDLTQLTFAQKYKQLYIHHIYKSQPDLVKNCFWTALSAIDANIFHQLNGFDTNFKGANGEDVDLGIRLTFENHNILSMKNAFAQHRHSFTVSGIFKNDLKKGISAVENMYAKKISISSNSHARKSDILAVFLSILLLASTLLSIIKINFVITVPVIFMLWIISRFYLIKTFYNHLDLFSFTKSIFLMITLDWVRALCVIIGFIKHKFIRSEHTSTKPILTSQPAT